MSSAGQEAIELAASIGLKLDPWQQYALDRSLGEDADGNWTAFEVGLVVARQNGKNVVVEARELAGLFLFGEETLIHTAHLFVTAQEAFRRILGLIENSDDLLRMVKRVDRAHGKEGIELHTGQRLRFLARSQKSGRGLSGDLIVFDEAYDLPVEVMGALLPTLSARPNPQVWYTSSAGHDESEVLNNVRARGQSGESEALCYLEYSAPPEADLDDRTAWRQANPAMGIRISEEFVQREREALSDEEFARERLGIWSAGDRKPVIDPDTWFELTDRQSQLVGTPCFSVDVPPDRGHASIAVAGDNKTGRQHIEIVEYAKGTAWVIERLVELDAKHRPHAIVLDPASPAGSLIAPLVKAGVEPVLVSGREYAQACGAIFDAINDEALAHISQNVLNLAVDAARKRKLGDAWAWSRQDATSDISPLVACTLALYGLSKEPTKKRRVIAEPVFA